MATTKLTTKGKSKITAAQVIALRKLAKANPELSHQQMKHKLKLALSTIMVGRCIRGISHGHIDMCGLEVRPMVAKAPKAKPTRKAPAKKAAPGKRRTKPAPAAALVTEAQASA
jgi:hypothetical protein